MRRSRGMTYELSDDFRLTASDFDFFLECGAFKDTLYKAFLQTAKPHEITPLFDTDLDELNAARDGMRPDRQWKNPI